MTAAVLGQPRRRGRVQVAEAAGDGQAKAAYPFFLSPIPVDPAAGSPPTLSTAGGQSLLPIFSSAGSSSIMSVMSQAVAGTGGPGLSGGVPSFPSSATPGLNSLPPKLVKRIIGKEFVDMRELLPESWRSESQPSSAAQQKGQPQGPITDFQVWAECFATLAGVLTTVFPEKAPHLLAYLRIIARASRNYEDSAWVSYDAAFRRQAANLGSLDWGNIDPVLYNETFTGKAKAMKRCTFCVVDTHTLEECLHAPKGWGSKGSGVSHDAQQLRTPARSTSRSGPRPEAGRSDSVEICRLYNEVGGAGCSYPLCRYAHLCAKCHRPHPQAECGRRAVRARSPLISRGEAKLPRR